MKRKTLSNNTVYQDMLREGMWKGLPVAGRRIIEELDQENQYLWEKVSICHILVSSREIQGASMVCDQQLF